jgi:hypothetical protein
MEQLIGETAGRIWRYLEENGEAAISQVPSLIKVKEPLSYLAIGWLAREGKLKFEVLGNRTLVSIAER